MYDSFYAKISAPFRTSESRRIIVPLADKLLTTLFYLTYPLLLLALLLKGAPVGSPLPFNPDLVACTVAPGTGFALVSLLRKTINAPRPYEVFDIKPLIIKDTVGQSFPSKHVYSSFAIAMCWLSFSFALGAILVALAFCIACIRVVGGVHFPKDVAAGALIGLAFGTLALVF